PKISECTPAASDVATTSGTKARVENSNSSSSIAMTTAASGAPKVAAMPAAAPLASRILRSDGDTSTSCPSSDPSAPPVTMMGPSAPKGPPVPMAIAADSGLATAVRGSTRLDRRRTASIASGMPWPLMIGAQRAMTPTSRPPITGTITTRGLAASSAKEGSSQPTRPNSARLVSSAIALTRAKAAPPARRPTAAARTDSSSRRRAEKDGGTGLLGGRGWDDVDSVSCRDMSAANTDLSDAEYAALLGFRTGLRRFLSWSAERAKAAGLTPAQHQLLLVCRGLGDDQG